VTEKRKTQHGYRDRIVELVRVHSSDLQDNEGNWRVHPLAQREALAGILEQVGIADALLAYRSQRAGGALVVIDGHLRREFGGTWPVLILDVTDDEADLLLTTLDPLASLAQMDGDKMRELTERVAQSADARLRTMLADLGTEAELAAFRAAAAVESGSTDDAEVPDYVEAADTLLEKWEVRYGDVWSACDGEHFIICGDCREAATWERLLGAAGLDSVNGVITSPPYAEQRKKQYGGVPEGEYVDWFEAVQRNIRTWLADDGSFFLNIKPHAARGQRVLYVFDLVLAMVRRWDWMFVDELIWYKIGLPGGWRNRLRNCFEPIYHFSKQRQIRFYPRNVGSEGDVPRYRVPGNWNPKTGNAGIPPANRRERGVARPGNVIQVHVNQEALPHAAVFPVALVEFFVKLASEDGNVWLDPFLGSGTTIVAAHRLGRRGLGIEHLARHVAVSLERMAALGMEPRLERREEKEEE